MQEVTVLSLLEGIPLQGSGVYRIRNKVNGKSYVGSSQWVRKRCRAHAQKMLRGAHCNSALKNAVSKYGAGAFEFSLLEAVNDLSKLVEREQHWIDELDAVASGYNMRLRAESNRGYRMSAEARARMSVMRRGRKLPGYWRKAISEGHAGVPHTTERKSSISAAKKGKKLSPEHADRSRQHLKKITSTEEHRERARECLRERNANKVWSEDDRRKISEAKRGRPAPRHVIENLIAYHTGRPKPPEVVAKIAASNRGKTRTPEQKARIRAGILAAKAAKKAAQAEGVSGG